VTIYLIRHGQTQWNKVHRWQGRTDIELDEVGATQALGLAKRLSGCNITTLYTSPLKRARMTAEAIGAVLGLEPFFLDDLQEIAFGHWEGLTLHEVRRTYPEQLLIWESQPYTDPGNGIESFSGLHDRAVGALRDICGRHNSDEAIAVVTHGAWIRAIILYILNIPLDKRLGFALNNAGVTMLKYNAKKNRFSLTALNEHWFLNDGALS
jgi:broad specificity phosphatase PhoE